MVPSHASHPPLPEPEPDFGPEPDPAPDPDPDGDAALGYGNGGSRPDVDGTDAGGIEGTGASAGGSRADPAAGTRDGSATDEATQRSYGGPSNPNATRGSDQ